MPPLSRAFFVYSPARPAPTPLTLLPESLHYQKIVIMEESISMMWRNGFPNPASAGKGGST